MKAPPSAALAFAIILSAITAHAQTAVFTFEQFSKIPAAPLLNVLPEVGAGSLRASFCAEEMAINTVASLGVVSGNVLSTGGTVIQVTLSSAVNFVSVGFAAKGGNFSLTLSSEAGGVSVAAQRIGPRGMKGGILSFTSATPFRSFTLTSSRDDFSIDNLVVKPANPVGFVAVGDSGQTLMMLGMGAAALVAFRRRCTAAR